MSGPSIMDSLFQTTLDDLIKGLRFHLLDSSPFLSKSVDDIRREITSTDLPTKSTALQKLTYLRSLHSVDDSFAAFHAVELSSSPRFLHKKIAYLSASLSFHSSTPVALLLTHQLRKDLSSPNPHEVTLALHCLSSICNPDLARDLTPEIFTLLSSSKLYLRKAAIATVLIVFRECPDSVRVCFKRLVENLESSDSQTVSAVISVFCELASREPRSYLPLAPEFYRVLVDSRNNWVLIKVLKIFAKLAPLEPRLANRIVEPICDLVRRSGAKSLVFECIRTIVTSLNEYESAVRLAVAKVKEFLVDDDPNLKYLGLQALSIVAYRHLWAVVENKEFVIKSLNDTDPNIKLEALRLVMVMVCEDNVAEICRVLLNYALKSDPEFCNEILGSVLSTCCANFYEKIVDFDWYVSVLGEMSRIPHCQRGEEIESQLIDIGMRVKDVRPELVRVGRDLLIDPALLGNPFLHRILSAAAWVSAEYVDFSNNPIELMEALLQPRTSLLPPSIRAVYILSVLKVLIFCLHSHLFSTEIVASSLCANDWEPRVVESATGLPESSHLPSSDTLAGYEQNEDFNPRFSCQSPEDDSGENDGNTAVVPGPSSTSASLKNEHFTRGSIVDLLDIVKTAFGPLAGSHEVEVQERVRNVLGLIELVEQEIRDIPMQKEGKFSVEKLEASEVIKLLHGAFADEIGPVSSSAQERVPIPDGLMLNENLNDLETICADIRLPTSSSFSLGKSHFEERGGASLLNLENKEESEPSSESTSLLAEHRKRHGLYYLHSETKETTSHDYPPANEPKLRSDVSDDVDDLVKLTEQSLVPKKKPNQIKPRPVVVRLDGDDVGVAVKKAESKDDLISGAVRDVLFVNEAIPTSSRGKHFEDSSSKKRGKEKVTIVQPLESTQNLANMGISEVGNSSLRRSRHVSHGKERKHRSPRKNFGESEEKHQSEKKKSGHRHGKSKARHRADGVVDVVAQTPVIPDFLL
ncbi:hypothetical protein RHMOL_Rhmol08G0158700 [Rhododendron molle]|uniref:Uncharacterized protein n=1 Tax=Rhododendron molle TaxID=49168 RepID=A0ACC0MQ55_RHOML|nr:hypothetical protein RHMOL_Rhmol08G0158700 [Rhododendron molle]